MGTWLRVLGWFKGAVAGHKATHQSGGADEISVAGLAGLLSADQHVLDAEVLAVAAAVAHDTTHENGGADEISVAALSGLLADDQHVLDAEVLSAAKTIKRSKSITVEDPTNSEDISIAFTEKAITITEIRAVLIGSSTPSVTWTIRHHATDRSNAGNEVVTGGTTTTSTTGGSDVTAFDDATIPADSFIWLETTAKSGTVTELHVTIVYTVD